MLIARNVSLTPAGAPAPVLRDLSFEVAPGEWLAVTGPNGCGKTCLALAAAGLAPPSGGSIEWEGAAVSDRAARRTGGPIAAVLQDPSSQLLQPSVAEELRFTAANLGRPADEIERDVSKWRERLGLPPDLSLDPHQLSAGQQQLVLLAAALIARPGLLVADEACAHLDRAARARAMDAVRAETRRGMSVLWVTQEEEERGRADREVSLGTWAGASAIERHAPAAPSGAVFLRMTIGDFGDSSGPRVHVVPGTVIEVTRPGVTALIGPNGSGKSVLLAAAVGLFRSPRVRIESEAGGLPPILVSQYPELQVFEDRVEDELCFAATSRGTPRDRAVRMGAEMLDALGMPASGLLSRSTWDLSSGEKRLLEVVSALIAPAGLIALDEPTAGIDAGRRTVLSGLISRISDRTPVLIATQDPRIADSLANRVHSLGSGAWPPPSPSKKTD